jgi:hypothetical protein
MGNQRQMVWHFIIVHTGEQNKQSMVQGKQAWIVGGHDSWFVVETSTPFNPYYLVLK